MRFITDQATQTVDAAISAAGNIDVVFVTVGSTRSGGSTTIFTDTISLGTSDGIIVGDTLVSNLGVDEDVTAIFQADVTSDLGIAVATSARADATVVLGAAGASTNVTGNVDVNDSSDGAAHLAIADGATVLLVGNIATSSDRWDSITIGGGISATQLTIQGDVEDNAPITLTDQATLVFDSTADNRTVASTIDADASASTTTIRVTGTTGDANVATFNAVVGSAHSVDTIILSDDATFAANLISDDVTIGANATMTLQGTNSLVSGDVSGEGSIQLGDTAIDTLTFNGGANTQTIGTAIDFSTAGEGILETANTAGLTFNGTIGQMRRAEAVQIAANNVVTFNNTVATEDFVQGTGSTITFNGTGSTQVTIGGGSSGVLSLGAGTLVLGSNIGNGDTVFDVTGGVATDGAFIVTDSSPAIAIQLSSTFTTGSITLINGDVNNTVSDAEIANFTIQNAVLTSYTLDQEGANNQDLIITAVGPRSTSEIAALLGVSVGEAATLRTALDAATAAGDTATVNAITAGLDAGIASATQTVQQLGTQSQTTGAGAAMGQQISGQNRDLAGNQLSARRSAGDVRFATAFAPVGETGFSGGDPASAFSGGSVWAEAFGGIADAQGNTTASGYDASFGGVAFGIDGTVNDTMVFGLMGSYSHADVEGEGAANASLQSTTYLLGAYGSYTGQTFYLDGFASYAFGQHDASRVALGQTYTGQYDSSQFTLAVSGGVPLEMHRNIYLTPNASLTWNYFDADGYTETGGGLAQQISSDSASQLTGTLGTRLHAVFDGIDRSGTTLVPELRLGLSYDIIDNGAVSTAAFTAGGASYQVTGLDTDDLGALVGLGLALNNPRWSAGLSYNGDLRSDFVSHTARAQVRLRF